MQENALSKPRERNTKLKELAELVPIKILPELHDAEITELYFTRGDSQPGGKREPVLTAKLHTWQVTGQVDERGYYVRHNHTLVTLRFHDIHDFSMEGFNQQNVISELRIEEQERKDGSSPLFAVKFWQCYGMGAVFRCARIEVVEVVPCTEDGRCMPPEKQAE